MDLGRELVAELVLGNHVEDGTILLSPGIKLIAGAEWMCRKAIWRHRPPQGLMRGSLWRTAAHAHKFIYRQAQINAVVKPILRHHVLSDTRPRKLGHRA